MRFFLPMAGTFMALAGAWLTVRNGGILKVLVVQNCTAKNLNGIKVGNTFLAAENSAARFLRVGTLFPHKCGNYFIQ